MLTFQIWLYVHPFFFFFLLIIGIEKDGSVQPAETDTFNKKSKIHRMFKMSAFFLSSALKYDFIIIRYSRKANN